MHGVAKLQIFNICISLSGTNFFFLFVIFPLPFFLLRTVTTIAAMTVATVRPTISTTTTTMIAIKQPRPHLALGIGSGGRRGWGRR